MRIRLTAATLVAWAASSSLALAQPAPPAPPVDDVPAEAEPADPPAEATEEPKCVEGEPCEEPAAEPPAPEPVPEPEPEPTPEPAAPPVEAPVQPAPVAPAPVQAQPAAPQDSAPEATADKPPEMTFGFELDGGVASRLEGASEGFRNEAPADISFGGGLWFAPNRMLSIGLSYQRLGLGTEETPAFQVSSLSVHRQTDAGWLTGRVYPIRGDKAGLYLAAMFGLSWQSLDANGTKLAEGNLFVSPSTQFRCSGSDSARLALGAGVGVDVDVEPNLAFVAQADLQAHQLSSDPVDLDGCAQGAGTATAFGARIGLMYRFDVGGGGSTTSASAKPTLRF